MIAAFASFAPLARAENVTLPPLPSGLELNAGVEPFLVGDAIGTQNYVCLPSGGGVAWTLFTPQASLFRNDDRQLTTRFFRPNPDEGGVVRAAWQDSRGTSTVWASLVQGSTDAGFVAPGAAQAQGRRPSGRAGATRSPPPRSSSGARTDPSPGATSRAGGPACSWGSSQLDFVNLFLSLLRLLGDRR